MALETLTNLKHIMETSKPSKLEILSTISKLSELLLEVGNEERESIIEAGGYGLITQVWTKVYGKKIDVARKQAKNKEPKITENEEKFLDPILTVLYSITPGHSDMTDKICNDLILRGLHPKISEGIKIKSLKLMRNICIKSERNRIVLIKERNVIPPFVKLIRVATNSPELVQAWVEAFGALILNDDPRFIVNQALESKYLLLQAGAVHELALLITKFKDVTIIKAILNVIRLIGNGEEYCAALDKVGAIVALQEQIIANKSRPKFLKHLLQCLKNLSTNVTIREKIGKTTIMSDVLTIIKKHKSDESFLQIGIILLGSLTVNSPCIVTQFILADGITLVLEAMKTCDENLNILKNSCFTLRNVAENGGRIGKKLIVEADTEALLHKLNAVFPDELETNHIYPLLKALGLEVPNDEAFDDSVSQRQSIDSSSTAPDVDLDENDEDDDDEEP